MKDIIKNNIIKKIIISIIVVVILCNFVFPNVGYCSTDVANALADFFLQFLMECFTYCKVIS